MPLACLFVGKVFTRGQICTDIVSVFTFKMLPVLSESFLFELITFTGRFSVSCEWKQGGFHSGERIQEKYTECKHRWIKLFNVMAKRKERFPSVTHRTICNHICKNKWFSFLEKNVYLQRLNGSAICVIFVYVVPLAGTKNSERVKCFEYKL